MCVILPGLMADPAPAYALENTGKGRIFGIFLSAGAAAQAARSEEALVLPQLKRCIEAGLSIDPNEYLQGTLALGGFIVSPSIPAGMLLYRGYSGFSLAGSLEVAPGGSGGEQPFLFVGLGAAASLAKYEHTELVFMEYSASLAPGIGSAAGPVVLRASLPFSIAVRGDAVAYSAGLRFAISRSRNRASSRRAAAETRP